MNAAEAGRDADLPWGHWLRRVERPDGTVAFVDADGRAWASVREAFWIGRLGMPPSDTADGQMDAVLEVMNTIAEGGNGAAAFRGAGAVVAVLELRGLASVVPVSNQAMELTTEGRAFRMMLRGHRRNRLAGRDGAIVTSG